MANDLVVNLGARLDQLQANMNQAGDIADSAVARIEKSFSNLNPGININGLTTVIAGAAAGFSALLAVVASLNKGLDDMAQQAERIGISTKRLQELQFAGSALGVKDIGAGLETFSQNVQSSLSRANDLRRVFEANKVAITDSNGQVRDMSKLLDSAVDIIRRAPKLADALQIGSFLGFSKEFSQAIYDAGAGFQQLASQANSVGAVIDEGTIQKAQTFTREWNRASAIWGTQMKASMSEWLPLLNDAIQVARTLIGYVGQVTGALSAIKDFAIAPNVDTASLSKLEQLNTQYQGILETLQRGERLNPIQLFQASNIQENGEVTIQAVENALVVIRDRILNFNKDPANRVIIRTDDPSVNPGLKQPDGGRDQFETTVDQISKRTAILKADTATVFANSAAQAQLRAEYSLLSAIVRDGGEVTEEQLEKYQELRKSMSATQALQASGIELTEKHGAAFKKNSEGIAAATAENTKARDSLNQLNAVSQQVGSALASSFADAIIEGKSLNDVLGSLLKSLARMAINSTFSSIFSPQAGGGLSPFASLFGGGGSTLNSNPWSFPMFANGTDFAPGGMAIVGERGPELVNLPRGSQVVPNAAMRGGGGGPIVFAPQIDARGADIAAVARLEQIMAEQQRSFAANVVATVKTARTARVL